MTDGILLAELQRDRQLRKYDTIIIDEAHERSLNIDFLLGYLKRLLPRRPDLKLIITSATIDLERFAAALLTRGKPAPIIEVSGRTYPVEVRYRPLIDARRGGRGGRGRRPRPDRGDRRRGQGALRRRARATSWCSCPASGRSATPPTRSAELTGDRAATRPSRSCRSTPGSRPPSSTGSSQSHHAGRRVVLATNVAETSLTVPGIRYVVDTGVARISPLLGAHQGAAAADRADQPGLGQPALGPLRPGRGGHRDPALLRGGLRRPAGVHRPGDPAHQPGQRHPADDLARARRHRPVPVRRAARQAQRRRRRPAARGARRAAPSTTDALDARDQAIGGGRTRLTGRPTAGAAADRPAAGPDDPRGRAARLRARGARDRGGAVAAGPARAAGRVPGAGRPAARALQGATTATSSPGSTSGATSRSSSASCRAARSGGCASGSTSTTCGSASGRTSSPSCARSARRWRSTGRAAQPTPRTPTASTRRCCPACSPTSALLEEREKGDRDRKRGPREYLGARGARFAIFPGSGLHRKNPQFLMAGELVETSRLWARQNAAIKPEWAERLGAHLVKRTYSEPHWSKKRAAVMAYERVTLYGVPLVADRLVSYGKVDRDAQPRAVHPARAGLRRVAHPAQVLRDEPAPARGGRGARAPRPAPRHRRRRAHALRLLRRPGRRRRRQRRPLRPVVEAGAADSAPTCSTFDPAMLTHDTAEAGPRGRLPRAVAVMAARA